MSIFKCKMCGGTLEINENQTTATCEYCGTQQTLPKLDDDRRAQMYDRANHFRRNNEFDKAMGIYEKILNEDSTDAEAYWSLVLCRFGIEYVEDPVTRKRVPTVNRAQFTSIFDDSDYKSALQYADGYQRNLYEAEAKAINEIQKGILAISQKEEPFDVFICYKETDNNGRRTRDSVLANDLYHQLTNEGFKVFFSRITLEDKLGTAYEPYIFAALNSAKVMVVLGTKPEHFNAVWVKNEWSRYLALVKQSGGKRILIPAYKDMDPYDLPEEFSHLQAQDMSKLGFMQDLIRGIKKLTATAAPASVVKETVVAVGGSGDVAPLLKRAFMFLEDGEFDRADEFCEQVLNQDPENAEAYLGKLMADLQVRNRQALKEQKELFSDNNNYQKANRFADAQLRSELKDIENCILYGNAMRLMDSAGTEDDFKTAAERFEDLSGYSDADEKVKECLEKAEAARKDAIYDQAARQSQSTVDALEEAIKGFSEIPGWKDSDERKIACQERIAQIREIEEKRRIEKQQKAEERRIAAEELKKKTTRSAKIVVPIAIVAVVLVVVINSVVLPAIKYNKAVSLCDAGDYTGAIEIFDELGDYKDSTDKVLETQYAYANYLVEQEDYNEAIKIFEELGDYKESKSKIHQYQFFDVKEGATLYFGSYEQDNDTSNGMETIEWTVLAKEGNKALLISKYGLDAQPYNTELQSATWRTCTLRKWLNNDFIDKAFTDEEQKKILLSKISNPDNAEYDTPGGKDTADKIFLLSIDETEKYFNSEDERVLLATAYAEAQGAYIDYDSGYSWWWLRSPGYISNNAAKVYSYGYVDRNGYDVDIGNGVVRPALWINLES